MTQNLLRLSFVGGIPVTTSGFSPDNNQFQASSLPSSVSDALEGTIGQSMEDLSLEELDPTTQLGGGGVDSANTFGDHEVRSSICPFIYSFISPLGYY